MSRNKTLYWFETDIPELYYSFVSGCRVEKLITRKGERFCVGSMEKALIVFESEKMMVKFLVS